MSTKKLILILIFLKLNFIRINSKETTCFINGQKSLNVVNERFISVSIDPSILLAGFNLSAASLQLAQSLSPAFIRIAGPSSQSLKFSDDVTLKSLLDGTSNFTVTPMMWKSLNYWIKNANLTPVFAISDQNRTDGFWNPTSALPLLQLSGKMNLTCYWQLGYDCKDKSIIRYKHDLFTLKQALKEYSSSMKYWKIVGSDLQHCLAKKNPELAKKTLEFLDDVTDAVIWQEPFWKNPTNFPATSTPIWLVVPERTQHINFASGLIWAKQIGEAAKSGYEVIFRQPSQEELSSTTPVYWISLIYKTLMGRNVLEISSNSLPERNVNIYANCAKNQDNYGKQGALSVFVVNNGTEEHVTSLRVGASHQGSIEVHSYIITSDGEDSINTYLNGRKLSFRNIREGGFELRPTLRWVRVNKALNLISPPKSVTFFVLPSAKIPVCIKREKETQVVTEELKINPREELREGNGRKSKDLKPEVPRLIRRKENVVTTERPINLKKIDLELTNEEISKILEERAKSKVPEVEEEPWKKYIIKRDINMELLDLQTPTKKKPSIENQEIQATIRKNEESVEENHEEKSEDVYAELASSLEEYNSPPHQLQRNEPSRKPYLIPQESQKEKLCPGAKYLDERVRFLMEPSGLETFLNEDLKDYHGLHENVRFEKMANPKTQFNNEIRNVEGGKATKPSKIEIGELYGMGRKNHDVEAREWDAMVKDNHDFEKMEEIAPLVTEKPDFVEGEAWYAMGRQNYDFGAVKMITDNPNVEVAEWYAKAIENNGERIQEGAGKHVTASPQARMTWKHDNYETAHASSTGFEETWKSTTEAQIPFTLEPWLRSSENPSEFSATHDVWGSNSNPLGNAELPPIFSTVKPQIEINSAEEKKSFSIVRPRIFQDVWQMDAFAPIENEKLETSPNFEAASTPSNTIWEVNAWEWNDEKKAENSSSIDEVSPWVINQTKVSELNQSLEDFLNLPDTTSREKFKALAEKTFKDIENFFSNPQMRVKREDTNITKGDIKNYRKFMNEQLRVMKKSRQEGSTIKPKLRSLSNKKDDALSSEGEHLHLVIGKPFDREKLHINERRRAKQEQKLKQRVQNRKKIEKLKERKERRRRSPYNTQTNEVCEKKLAKPYTRRIFGPRTWKPQDISNLKKIPSYSTEIVDKREFSSRTAPFVKFEGKRGQRSLDGDDDSSENAIHDDYDLFKNPWDGRTKLETVTHPDQGLFTNQTEKPEGDGQKEAETFKEHHFIDMLVDAVNTTITTFVHLTEKIGKQFSF